MRGAANDFIFWLVNRENTIRVHETIGYLPVRKGALSSLELGAFHRRNPNYRVAVEEPEHAAPARELARTEEKKNAMLE